MKYGIETFTGVRPTADLTIANYIGAVKPVLDREKAGSKSTIFLAELHAATTSSPKEVLQNSAQLARTYVATGVEGEIYRQHDVKDLVAQTEFAIRGLTTVSRLLRLPTLKDKVRESDDVSTASVALAMYPMMMASDIILARPKYVPTGKDQKSHLELTNELVRLMNRDFNTELPELEHRDIEPVNIMSLDHSGRKMSKTSPKGAIYLDDPIDVARKKIMKAPTASGPGPEMDLAVNNLTTIAKGLTSDKDQHAVVDEYAARVKDGEQITGRLKGVVADITVDFLTELDEKRQSVSDKEVRERLEKGHEWFRPIGAATLAHIDERQWRP